MLQDRLGGRAQTFSEASTGGGAVRLKEREGCGKGLTFYRDFPTAGQVGLVAHQDDGHVVSLMRAPQLDSELRGTLKAAAICDGVHDDVGTASLQA